MNWETPINNNLSCNICGPDKDIDRQKREIMSSGTTRQLIGTGKYSQLNLCRKCKEASWFIEGRPCPRPVFCNTLTNKTRFAEESTKPLPPPR